MTSSDESSDDDYKPQSEESDIASEVETDYDSDGNKIDKKLTSKSKKRRKRQNTSNQSTKRQTMNINNEAAHTDNSTTTVNDDEEEKRRSEALWADFLNDTNSASSLQKSEKENCESSVKKETVTSIGDKSSKKEAVPIDTKIKNESKSEEGFVTKIFDYAGEEVKVIEKIKSDYKKPSKPPVASTSPGLSNPLRRCGVNTPRAGLSSALSQLGKKNKLSTLEKTKHDWNSYKSQQGIEEELQTFNKGKDGFLERQDFLERTDVRQFEMEKSLRQSRRGNR